MNQFPDKVSLYRFMRVLRLESLAQLTAKWGRGRKRLLYAGAAFALLTPANLAWAQSSGRTPPPAPPPAPNPPSSQTPSSANDARAEAAPEPDSTEDPIVITAPAQQSSIDRQTYIIRDTPEARSSNTNDILARIPSVEVQADGTVRLVGAGNATVLIDGRRVADPATMLRNMTGNQIERIEVLTNPGAEFPAQGTGGIVNIVTRRNTQAGLGGSSTATISNYGGYDLRVSPTYAAGNWTLIGNAGHGRGENRARFERERFSLQPAGPLLESSESGRQIAEFVYYYANGSASYRPNDRRTITLAGTAAHTDFTQTVTSLLTDAAIPGGSADQRASTEADFNYRDLSLDYRGTTGRQGESLTASLKWTRSTAAFESLFSTDLPAGRPTCFSNSGARRTSPGRRRRIMSGPSNSPGAFPSARSWSRPATAWPRSRPAPCRPAPPSRQAPWSMARGSNMPATPPISSRLPASPSCLASGWKAATMIWAARPARRTSRPRTSSRACMSSARSPRG
jgi:hypothetical protein